MAILPPSNEYFVGHGVVIHGEVAIGSRSIIEDYCILGKPDMYFLERFRQNTESGPIRPTTIGRNVVLGAGTKVYCGTTLEDWVETEDNIRVGWDAHIGTRTRLMFGAQVYCGVHIGADCRIAGFVGDNSVIGERVSFFGNIVHDYPYRTTTYEPRPSATVDDDAIVAFGAVLVGGVRVGKGAYVAANAVVTRDVPRDAVCFGVNQHVSKSAWRGRLGVFDAATGVRDYRAENATD